MRRVVAFEGHIPIGCTALLEATTSHECQEWELVLDPGCVGDFCLISFKVGDTAIVDAWKYGNLDGVPIGDKPLASGGYCAKNQKLSVHIRNVSTDKNHSNFLAYIQERKMEEPTKLPTLDVELATMRAIDKELAALPPFVAIRILTWAKSRVDDRIRQSWETGAHALDYGDQVGGIHPRGPLRPV